MQTNDTGTIELLTPGITPRQLLVLLHDAGGTAADMLVLGNLLGDAFPEAAIPWATSCIRPSWTRPSCGCKPVSHCATGRRFRPVWSFERFLTFAQPPKMRFEALLGRF